MMQRLIAIHDQLRYAAGANASDIEIDGYLNYHFLTSPLELGFKKMILEAGINQVANIRAQDQLRRPAIALRSSPRKAGGPSNPWHDEFDLDHGFIRYFGDHKVTTLGLPGATPGNRALMDAWQLHSAPDRQSRAQAPPLLVFRAISVSVDGKRIHQGYVEFCGAALIERFEHVVQRDPTTGKSFPNIALDLAVIQPDEFDSIDMRWIDDRRNPELDAQEALRFAPKSWRRWVNEGRSAIPRIRRRVLSSKVRSKEDQLPELGSPEEKTLDQIYRFFDGRKHAFEALAARIAAEVLQKSGARYHPGWLTRSGGDGGVDFIGRLDVGTPQANTPIVVLGQAKCISPSSAVSPDQVARVVARLRRGWVGVFVTTGSFSNQAQVEVIDDQYPLVLVPGRELVAEALKIAASDFDADLDAFLESVSTDYENAITARRPEEILWA